MAGNQKKFLFFVSDGAGLGHLHRMAKIAKALQKSASCLVVSGHRATSWIVSEDCEYIHLPSFDSLLPNRARHWGRKPFMEFSTHDEIINFRKNLLKQVIETYSPDGIFTDYLPLGKFDEMAEIIESHSAKKYFIVRGILDDPNSIRGEILGGKGQRYLEEFYDKIFVTCDKKICDVVKEYKLNTILEKKLEYVGYVAELINLHDIEQTRLERGITSEQNWVVCSVGGGKAAEGLVQECINIAHDYPNILFDVIVGPRSNYACEFKTAEYKDYGNLRLHKENHYLKYLHASADIVICHGGYNSLVECLQGKAKIICYPTQDKPNSEQYIHSHRLAEFSNITTVTNYPDLKNIFKQAVKTLIFKGAFKEVSNLDFQGVEKIRNIVYKDLNIG
ncbi:MAG: hypothetical protein J0H12_07210 [Candidatus Paracaedimonas acanthamoebae]|uniref:Glycosyl transferase family 28 C-terminal domain-containing protein n=1 Tax=Candidatus Paracaedimonas acanthamoebae TaxID=244581 RepID=A0A8J7Q218_9PROT|nr:hypothetical protein [Candidatus Paracaedimonas acanthamoebae]